MLSYDEFKERFVKEILAYLPEEYSDCDVKIERILKNNGRMLDGLLIKSSRFNVSPNIYLESFYEDYKSGITMEEIMRRVASIRTGSDYKKDIDTGRILDIDVIRDHILPMVVNYSRNLSLLENRPHKKIMDLAVIYYVDVVAAGIMKQVSGNLSLGITKDLAEIYGLDGEDLYELAIKNMKGRDDVELRYIHDEMISMKARMMAREDGVDEDYARHEVRDSFEDWNYGLMYLTNNKHDRGAALILREDIRELLVRTLNGGFYILPSSIHEVILISENFMNDVSAMKDIVSSVNEEMRDGTEFLSDSIYYCDASEEVLKQIA